jgi:hypothetical protein
MEEFFYKLNYKLLDDVTETALIQIAEEKKDEFIQYAGHNTGRPDGNYYFIRGPLRELAGVQKWVRSCVIDCYPLIMRHYPNIEVPKHVDNPNGRNCIIISPITPIDDYVPTHFYSNIDDREPAATIDFKDRMPVLLNTQQVHGLQNNNNLRINFQLCFTEKYEVVKDLLETGQLFKKVF